MNTYFDAMLVGLMLAAAVGYIMARLRNAATKHTGACGGCGNCASLDKTADADNAVAAEVRIPASKIGRR